VAGVNGPARAVAPMLVVAVTPDGRRTNARLRGMRVCEDRLPSVNVPQALVWGLRG